MEDEIIISILFASIVLVFFIVGYLVGFAHQEKYELVKK